jgi:hypothetical protein
MLPVKQNLGEKLLNDYLFATSRYINDRGMHVHGNVLSRDLSSPRLKTQALSTAAMSFMFAAAGAPGLAVVNALVLPANLITSWAINIHSDRKLEPKYYFDTAPQRKTPLKNEAIIRDLSFNISAMKMRLLFTTALYSTFAAGTYALVSHYGAAPLAPVMIAVNASLAIARGTDIVGDAWRSKMALDGKWNILTKKPEAETVTHRAAEFAPSPT